MNLKRNIYIILTMTLGLIFSFLLHAVIETVYLNNLLEKRLLPEPSSFNHQCYLPLFLQILLPLTGLVAGYFLGRKWWDIVYIKQKR